MSSAENLKDKIEALKKKLKTSKDELNLLKNKNESLKKDLTRASEEKEKLIASIESKTDKESSFETLISEISSLTDELERIQSDLKFYDTDSNPNADPQLTQDPLYLSHMKNIFDLYDATKSQDQLTSDSIPSENDPYARLQYFKNATSEIEKENMELAKLLGLSSLKE